ncbi:MAG: hypothetical protein AB7O97_04605 [Planctomycetota bacterium]
MGLRGLLVTLYAVFLFTTGIVVVSGVAMIWGASFGTLWARVVGTCAVLSVASALTMSATRLVKGPPPEDDRG